MIIIQRLLNSKIYGTKKFFKHVKQGKVLLGLWSISLRFWAVGYWYDQAVVLSPEISYEIWARRLSSCMFAFHFLSLAIFWASVRCLCADWGGRLSVPDRLLLWPSPSCLVSSMAVVWASVRCLCADRGGRLSLNVFLPFISYLWLLFERLCVVCVQIEEAEYKQKLLGEIAKKELSHNERMVSLLIYLFSALALYKI